MFPLPPFLALFRASLLSGTALLARGEPAGLFVDLTVADQTKAVLVRNSGDTYFSPDAFFSNAGTSPKLVYDATGTLVWSPHNILLYSDDLTNAAWTAGSGTTKSAVTGGTRIQLTDGSSSATQSYTTVPGGQTWCVSARVRATSGSQTFRLRATQGGVADYFSGDLVATTTAQVFSFSPGAYGAGGSSIIAGVVAGVAGAASDIVVEIIQLNRGSVPTAYLATTSATRFGLAIDYDPVTHACKGQLVEAAVTNVLTHTGDGYASGWTFGGGAFSGTTAGPDGQQSLKKLTPNTSNANQQAYQGFTATVAAYTNSIIAKAGGYSWLGLCFGTGGSAATDGAYFNLSTGVVGTVAAGSTATIQSLGGGVYRCSVTRTLTAATWYQQIEVHSADNTGTMTGDGTSGIYVGFSQLELGSVATSPIPTFAATVTRARDLPNYLLSAIPSVAAAVGMFAEFQQTAQESTVTRVISLDDGTTGTRTFIAVTTSALRGGAVVSTVAQATIDVGATAINVTQKAAFSAALNDFRFAAGGVLGVPDVSGTYPSVTTGRLGYDAQSQALVGGLYIQKFGIVPRTLTDGELQARST